MFYHLEGVVSLIDLNFVVIDCSGVGYGVNTTANTLSQLKLRDRARLYISESIKEDSFELYGFSTMSEKRCFDMLISVSGIGPKAAQSILSAISPDALALAIMNGDDKAISAAQGVGKKIAQRVILELKDKVSKSLGAADMELPAYTKTQSADTSGKSDAVAALMVLGYSAAEINGAMKKIDTNGMTTERIVKEVLKQLV